MLVSPSFIKQLTPLQKKIRAIAGQVYRQETVFQELDSFTREVVRLGNVKPLPINKAQTKELVTLMNRIFHAQRDIFNVKDLSQQSIQSNESIVTLIQQLLQNKKIGNCEEFNRYLQDLLYKQGVNSVMIKTKIQNEKQHHYCNDHYCLATLLNPTSNLNDPNTWGNEAMILDAWMPIIAPALHALKRFKQVLKVDETLGESLVFKGDDLYTRISPYTPKQHEYLLNRKSP